MMMFSGKLNGQKAYFTPISPFVYALNDPYDPTQWVVSKLANYQKVSLIIHSCRLKVCFYHLTLTITSQYVFKVRKCHNLVCLVPLMNPIRDTTVGDIKIRN